MSSFKRAGLLTISSLVLCACSAVTQLSSTQADANITIKGSAQTSSPRSEKFSTTSFGNYEFKAEQPGGKSMYGVLPLKFNGGYLATDILFFAPAAFFNLREVYPFYEFDVDKGIVRYKKAPQDSWTEYSPLAAESERAKAFFKQGK